MMLHPQTALRLGALAALVALAASRDVDKEATCRPQTSVLLATEALDELPGYVQLLQQGMLVARAETRTAVAAPAPEVVAPKATAATDVSVTKAALVEKVAQPKPPPLPLIARASGPTTTAAGPTENTTTTTLDPTGMSMNSEGDFAAFVASTGTNVVTILFCLVTFTILRVHYPRMYSNNVIMDIAPGPKPDITAHLAWIKAAFGYSLEEAIETIGLDHAMMLEFTHLCMKVMLIIGAPMLCILAPMHYFLGGHVAGDDRLSYLSFGNIAFNSWLYWVHAFVVWGVVFTVQVQIYAAQKEFLKYRFQWLRRMGDIRANTVLVEGIPHDHQSDSELKNFFDLIFPGNRVESTYVAKDTKGLLSMCAELEAAKAGLAEAEAMEKKDPSLPVMMRDSLIGTKVRAVDHWKKEIQELTPKIEALRKQVKEEAGAKAGYEGGNCANGFVTFTTRADAELALRLDGVTQDDMEFVISTPPMPNDILWGDLTQDVTAQEGRSVTGYLLILGLYFAYMPAVVGMTNIAKSIDMGPMQSFWAGLAPTFGLTVMVSFLPTFLTLIFNSFFTLKAAAWAQHHLQTYYFWFQLVFVILATAVGQNVAGFTEALVADPLTVFDNIARTMPFATHFYMNYLVLQMTTHTMNILRYINLTKYLGFRSVYDDNVAASMAEPEDQDYYGIGSRSARWTINMVIGIVFGTLCPPMYFLTFANFAVCRLIYGYLFAFAETKKADLGGVFWVTQLRHLFVGNILYVILMTSVLFQRASTIGPAVIAAPSLIYVIWSMLRFDGAFSWEKLPFQELMTKEDVEASAKLAKRDVHGMYKQPELFPEAAA